MLPYNTNDEKITLNVACELSQKGKGQQWAFPYSIYIKSSDNR